jgi:hypothetical protein
MTVRGLDVEFPQWRHLIPSDEQGMGPVLGIGYNPGLVAKFGKVRADEGARMVVFRRCLRRVGPGRALSGSVMTSWGC